MHVSLFIIEDGLGGTKLVGENTLVQNERVKLNLMAYYVI
jgi:hypothetical protein